MAANVHTRLGGYDGISYRSLGFYERKKKVVAITDNRCLAVHRGFDYHVERIGSRPIYLYTILRRDHDD